MNRRIDWALIGVIVAYIIIGSIALFAGFLQIAAMMKYLGWIQ